MDYFKNVDKDKVRRLRKELKATEANRLQEDHSYCKVNSECCQIHRDKYDRKFEKIGWDLDEILEDGTESRKRGNLDTVSGISSSLSDVSSIQDKKGMRSTLYMSP